MDAISNVFYWLFNDRTGVLVLMGGGILLFALIAWLLERQTRQKFYNHEKGPDDWDLFGSEDE